MSGFFNAQAIGYLGNVVVGIGEQQLCFGNGSVLDKVQGLLLQFCIYQLMFRKRYLITQHSLPPFLGSESAYLPNVKSVVQFLFSIFGMVSASLMMC